MMKQSQNYEINDLVLYYDSGWYAGYVEEIGKNTIGIRPVAGYKGGKKNLVWIPFDSVKLAKERNESREVLTKVRKRNRRV